MSHELTAHPSVFDLFLIRRIMAILSKKKKGCKQDKSLKLSFTTQSAIACSKLTMETLEQGVKYVQS